MPIQVIQFNYQRMFAFGKLIECSCVVQNLENKNRAMNQVVFSENADGLNGVPYSPQVFPLGAWPVRAPIPEPESNPYEFPFFIPTDAHQLVDEWGTVQREALYYTQKTGRQVMDWGYGIHFSKSMVTLGCIRIASQQDLMFIVSQVQNALKNGVAVMIDAISVGAAIGGAQ